MGRRSSIQENTEQLILDTIIFSVDKRGISKTDLIQRVYPLDQSTVYRVTKKLEEEGLIKIIRKGQRTRYVSVSSSKRNIALGAYLIGKRFVSDHSLLGSQGLVLCNHVQTYPDRIDFSSYTQYFEPKFTGSSLEKTIFEFSNQIGAFISYIFIQAMNADNITKLQLLQRQRNTSKDIARKERQSRFITEEWISNSICSSLVRMLWRFNNMLKPFGYIPDIQTEHGLKKRKKLGPYLLEKKTIAELSKAFAHVYPYLNHELEKIRTGLHTSIRAHEEFEQQVRVKFEKQNKCAHNLSKTHIFESDDHRRKITVQTCAKCGYQNSYEEQAWPS